MSRPDGLLYSRDHEWARIEGDVATIGITDYAQNSLGDIVYVELPRVGTEVAQFGNIGVIESVKAVSELFTPLGGDVLELNPLLETDPAVVNREPFGDGWLLKVRVKDDSERANLLSAAEYAQVAGE
jgi:glycine cleavage system H protein